MAMMLVMIFLKRWVCRWLKAELSQKHLQIVQSVIFNESAIAAMGLKNPIGKTVSLWGQKKQIVGVVKDYHFESLYDKIGPSFLVYHRMQIIHWLK